MDGAPDIHGKQGCLPVMEGVLCVGGLGDLELAAIQHQPGPPRAKLGGSSLCEGLLELLVAAQVAVNGLCNGASGGSCRPATILLRQFELLFEVISTTS